MLYEKLNEEMQYTVDEFVGRIRPLSWRRRIDLLAQAGAPFADQFDAAAASLALKGFVTAVLERLNPLEVDDPFLAYLLSLSLNPEHKTAALAYLARHPDARRLVGEEWGVDDAVN
ncbi:MAG TPA: hypothetical protein VF017_05415 [Thermoanaerobaculia bacterium]|nr:hypothetical protein [Thermoanaerobaculia bacterium]